MITDPEIIAAYNEDALGIKGKFKGLFRPNSEAEVIDMVRACASNKMPLTAQGLRSSLTGAAICEKGVALSLERMNRLIDIDVKRKSAVMEPGIILGHLKSRSRTWDSCMRRIPPVPKSVPWAGMWPPMHPVPAPLNMAPPSTG